MAYMHNNIPKYTTDSIDILMYRNLCDVLEDLDRSHGITFEENKRNIAKVLRLIESIPLMPSLDFISQAHVLYNTRVMMNYSIIKDILVPYHRVFHDSPNMQQPPFSELVIGKLILPIQEKDKFKECTIKITRIDEI
ncbi:hypothetical protein I4U23_010938 [Adineta vaga]|nr:hypothetical protein I4U23_010938 [Adineta vaga]